MPVTDGVDGHDAHCRCCSLETGRNGSAGLSPPVSADDSSADDSNVPLQQAGRTIPFESIVAHSTDLLAITGSDRCLRYASPAFKRIFGDDAKLHLSRPVWELIHPDDRPRIAKIFAKARAVPGAVAEFECRILKADGSTGHVFISQVNRLDDPDINGFVGTVRDVTGSVEMLSDLAHQATHDPLTGLANRTVLFDRVERAIGRSARGSYPVVAMFLDLDDFSAINNQHGHAFGDTILREVARRLNTAVRETDTVARFGGDEFVVIAEDVTEDETQELADRIRTALARHHRLPNGGTTHIGVSIGIASSRSTASPHDLIVAADRAMYAAKEAHVIHLATADETVLARGD